MEQRASQTRGSQQSNTSIQQGTAGLPPGASGKAATRKATSQPGSKHITEGSLFVDHFLLCIRSYFGRLFLLCIRS
jgi:hypothetical protein